MLIFWVTWSPHPPWRYCKQSKDWRGQTYLQPLLLNSEVSLFWRTSGARDFLSSEPPLDAIFKKEKESYKRLKIILLGRHFVSSQLRTRRLLKYPPEGALSSFPKKKKCLPYSGGQLIPQLFSPAFSSIMGNVDFVRQPCKIFIRYRSVYVIRLPLFPHGHSFWN